MFGFGFDCAALPADEVTPSCFKQNDQKDYSVHIIYLRNITWY